MLVLTRKADERIVIGDNIELVVLSVRGNRVRLGVVAPTDVPVVRGPSRPSDGSGTDSGAKALQCCVPGSN